MPCVRVTDRGNSLYTYKTELYEAKLRGGIKLNFFSTENAQKCITYHNFGKKKFENANKLSD